MSADSKPWFPFPVPSGCFAMAWSEELAPGARVLDAYCPHLHAHLGCGGRVRGWVSAP